MRKLSTAILTLTIAASAAACGGGSSSGGGTPTPSGSAAAGPNGLSNPTAAKAQITTLYSSFFSAPVPKAKTMLEDGPTLSAAFKAALKLKGKAAESAKVDTVKITGAGTAMVTYDLLVDGKPQLKGADGNAVFVDGQWKVAKATFCGLVELGTPNVKGC